MRPQNTREWRKARRAAMRDIPAGRRKTHPARSARGQRRQSRELVTWLLVMAGPSPEQETRS
jgi:hypothetical protein